MNYEARLFGMTLIDIRRLVFQYCEANKIKHSFNQAHKMAGEDWAAGFLKRHRNLSVRKPEAVSIFRAAGFNREKVSRFYDALEAVMFKDNVQIIPATNIYNVDESGYTVCHKPKKIVGKRGKKLVGAQSTQQSSSPIKSMMIVLFRRQLHKQKCWKHHFQTFSMQESL